MAGRRKGRHSAKLNWTVILLVSVVVAFCVLSTLQDKHGLDLGIPSFRPPSLSRLYDSIESFLAKDDGFRDEMDNALAVSAPVVGGPLEVHFLDVGQAESILIKAPGKTVLIDAGENNQGGLVLRYLKAQSVKRVDILIGTHPHSDHIGGMDDVVNGTLVGEVVLPEIPEELVPATATYTDLLEAIEAAGLTITVAEPGLAFDLGGGARLTVLAPLAEYADLNNMSVVARLSYGDTSFLFTGDASAASEKAMLEEGAALKSDVLSVGHHGSNSATTEEFLQAASPRIAIISCGVDNTYGHPHREVIERLQEREVQILRTDRSGTIVIVSDGNRLGIQTDR